MDNFSKPISTKEYEESNASGISKNFCMTPDY